MLFVKTDKTILPDELVASERDLMKMQLTPTLPQKEQRMEPEEQTPRDSAVMERPPHRWRWARELMQRHREKRRGRKGRARSG
jgi:hypothetical protein